MQFLSSLLWLSKEAGWGAAGKEDMAAAVCSLHSQCREVSVSCVLAQSLFLQTQEKAQECAALTDMLVWMVKTPHAQLWLFECIWSP